MSAPVPTVEPTKFSVGDTLLFTRDLSDYPASEWTLTYHITNADNTYSFVAIADGDTFSINVQKVTTTAWIAGDYQLNGHVDGTVDGVEAQFSVYGAPLTLLPNKASTQPIEIRSWAQQALDAVEAALLADAGRGSVIEYSINGRSIRSSYEDAMKYRDYLKTEVAVQAGRSQRKILTRFLSPR